MIVTVILAAPQAGYPHKPFVHRWGLIEAYYLDDAKSIALRYWKPQLDENPNLGVHAFTIEDGFRLLDRCCIHYDDFEFDMPRQ
jgi:hypothetical protein